MKVVNVTTPKEEALFEAIMGKKFDTSLSPRVKYDFIFDRNGHDEVEYTFQQFFIWAIENGKLAVECKTTDEADKVCKVVPNSVDDWNGYRCVLMYYNESRNISFVAFSESAHKSTNHTLTASEFLKWFESKEELTEREIIGYAAPFDIKELGIKKGDVFTKRMQGEYATGEYPKAYLIKSFVETWQAIYQKTEAEEQAEMWIDVFHMWQNVQEGQDFSKALQTKFKLVRI